ncbi:MAG: endonuclease [Paludibacter sp.]|jgi:predicted extracellular nuclease|nr:endonuclease [Paludibacter sp.]
MRKFLQVILFLLSVLLSYAQSYDRQRFIAMCYNVENYFDIVDDSLTNDAEYLPGGMRGWNNQKYKQKQENIGKAIVAIGSWTPPAIVGLCEVESERGLTDLTKYSGLKSLKYKYVHYDSPDARGVDVALLYQPDRFQVLGSRPIRVDFPFAPQSKTRDILYVQGKVPTGDTLNVFICHFPSRLGGELESEERRVYVAEILRNAVDSLFAIFTEPAILIMGDFNDYPTNKSMSEILQALPPNNAEISPRKLYNLMYPLHISGKGSHKNQGEWGALDQIIVSGRLLDMNKKFSALPTDVHIFDADFLLEADDKFLGVQPKRTYIGMRYNHGFADHLPVYLDFWY